MHLGKLLPRRARRAGAALALAGPLALVSTAAACGPRQVQVSGSPEPVASTLSFTNRLRTAVNVYVRGPSGAETFVRQVPAGATESLAVRNVAPGARVSLRAAPVNGAPGYTRADVTLGTGAAWTVP